MGLALDFQLILGGLHRGFELDSPVSENTVVLLERGYLGLQTFDLKKNSFLLHSYVREILPDHIQDGVDRFNRHGRCFASIVGLVMIVLQTADLGVAQREFGGVDKLEFGLELCPLLLELFARNTLLGMGGFELGEFEGMVALELVDRLGMLEVKLCDLIRNVERTLVLGGLDLAIALEPNLLDLRLEVVPLLLSGFESAFESLGALGVREVGRRSVSRRKFGLESLDVLLVAL